MFIKVYFVVFIMIKSLLKFMKVYKNFIMLYINMNRFMIIIRILQVRWHMDGRESILRMLTHPERSYRHLLLPHHLLFPRHLPHPMQLSCPCVAFLVPHILSIINAADLHLRGSHDIYPTDYTVIHFFQGFCCLEDGKK